MAPLQLSLPAFFSICLLFTSGVFSQSNFTILNNCTYPVWPAILSSIGSPEAPTSGFLLDPNYYTVLPFPASWYGNIWGRTLCTTNNATGNFSCITGDCGSGTHECFGFAGFAGAPATIASITLDGVSGLDYYNVDLSTGFNLPLVLIPQGGNGTCTAVGCPANINPACPSELQDVSNGQVVGCKSGCVAFGDPRDCCTMQYGSPNTCGPTNYTEFFKGECPLTRTYAFDLDTVTCDHANYLFAFCADI